MTTESVFFLVNCDQVDAKLIDMTVKNMPDSSCQISEAKRMSGATIEWIVFGTATLGAITQLIDLINNIIAKNKTITVIKIGELVIENPKPEDIEFLKNKYGSQKQSQPKTNVRKNKKG